MIQAIIFSKDRPAQLDLLLRSIKSRAPLAFDPITVILTWSDEKYLEGYKLLDEYHPTVRFLGEEEFHPQAWSAVRDSKRAWISFFCDDDIFLRPLVLPLPEYLLTILGRKVLCVSLRLGENTTECYPLRRPQTSPASMWKCSKGYYLWEWAGADGDWGYPGSLDGHIFWSNALREMLDGQSYSNPNQLEERLNAACHRRDEPYMVCYANSIITGNPVNRVNTTHPNRAGEKHLIEPEVLNNAFLKGKRLMLGGIDRTIINAAHTEIPLRFST